MFSEYASRFLDQSRIPFAGDREQSRDRQRSSNRYQPNRRFYQPTMPSPYQPSASQISRFPFASRTSAAAAPLFYSATDEFREEDDAEEHEKSVADFYALQRSRRYLGNSLSDQSEEGTAEQSREEDSRATLGRGIKSSWRGGRVIRGRPPGVETVEERDTSTARSEASAPSSKGKGKLVDVELASTVQDSIDEVDPREASDVEDSLPPAFQQFRKPPTLKVDRPPPMSTAMPIETDEETARLYPRPQSPTEAESTPPIPSMDNPPRHDEVWGQFFVICVLAVLATAFLVYLHTEAPDKKHPLGDTIYSTLHASFHLLAVDTLISIVVSVIWITILRNFLRPLVVLIIVAVPVILFSFSLYPYIWSYKGSWHGGSAQDKVMRWFSFVPFLIATGWVWTVYKGRRSFAKATELLEFSCKILSECPALMLVGFANLSAIVIGTWIFLGIFTRVFLGGHFTQSSKLLFIIDSSTWWLGAFYVLTFLWSMGVISGIQRSATASTVSQWYFHRHAVPKASSRLVVQASLYHSATTLFGTICLFALITLAVRLPLLIFPRRIVAIMTLIGYSCVPAPIATLTNPLALTFAAIHSQALSPAARNVSQLSFVSNLSPTTTLTPASTARAYTSASLQPYRLAKLILHSTRWILTSALGFGAWVTMSRSVQLIGAGWRGSLYAWVIGLIAAAIGWAVSGTMEGVIGGILDALAVCWASEVGADENGARRGGRYCREAGELFGEEK